MNRDDMFEAVMRNAGISKANVSRFYDGLVELAKKQLLREKRFVLPGLGALVVRRRKARTARNPQTGQPIHVPARKAVRFRAYGELDELLNGPGKKSSTPATEPPPELPMDSDE